MSDPTSVLQPAIGAALKADINLMALFPNAVVKVYDGVAPVNAVEPYIVLGLDVVDPLVAEGFDGATVTCIAHVWSLTDPPGMTQARAIATELRTCLASVGDVAGFYIELDPASGATRYLIDQDGRTAHAVVQVEYVASPH